MRELNKTKDEIEKDFQFLFSSSITAFIRGADLF